MKLPEFQSALEMYEWLKAHLPLSPEDRADILAAWNMYLAKFAEDLPKHAPEDRIRAYAEIQLRGLLDSLRIDVTLPDFEDVDQMFQLFDTWYAVPMEHEEAWAAQLKRLWELEEHPMSLEDVLGAPLDQFTFVEYIAPDTSDLLKRQGIQLPE